MRTEIKKPTQEEQAFFENWRKELEKALRGKKPFPTDKTHLLQCPATVRLTQHGFRPELPLFHFWGAENIVSFRNTQYFKLIKVTKRSESNIEKPLPIIRSYRHGGANKKGEQALTFLYEKPSDKRLCNVHGNLVDHGNHAHYYYPLVLSEDAQDTLRFKTTPQLQQQLTPLGKKGLLAFHTPQQYNSLENTLTGKFQRFFIGTTPESGIVRAAHTLRKLAKADPKTVKIGIDTLLTRFQTSLKDFAAVILGDFDDALEYGFVENLRHQAEDFARSLPSLNLGDDTVLQLCPERTNGYTYQTCAVSLQAGKDPAPKKDSDKTDKTPVEPIEINFPSVWKNLIS